MKGYLEKMLNRESLTIEEMKAAATSCFADTTSESELAAFLTALRAKGETPEEIAGLVEVIRAESSQTSNVLTNVMDNCGTGGDGSHSFNSSTTAAFVIAGAGVTVAKHGNRSISSKTGSADVLEHLGISLAFQKGYMEEILQENQIAFLYAPNIHTGMKRFMKVRQDLRIPTVFNIIGPLTNPVELDTQLIGVYRRELLPMIAETLHQLGRKRALVINGAGFMDEASLAGENHISLLEQGEITNFTVHPSELDLPVYPNEQIRGGDAKENAEILLNVLNGKPGAYYNTVLLNANIGIYAYGAATTLKTVLDIARDSIASGAALEKLNRLKAYSKKIPSGVI